MKLAFEKKLATYLEGAALASLISLGFLVLWLVCMAQPAHAQQVVGYITNGGVGTTVAVSSANPLPTTSAIPSPSSAVAITPVVSSSAEASHVLKNAAGNLYSVSVTTGATAGYLMVFNATSAPADGAVTPIQCVYVPATSSIGLNFNPGPPENYSTGITVVFSSTGCFTKTGSATAFFHGSVQ